MMFKGKGPLPNLELIGKDKLDPHNTGDHPWTVEHGIRSILFLFNHSQTELHPTIRIGSGTDVWLKTYTLRPNQTFAFDVNRLIESQEPDDRHHPFNQKVTSGEVSWWVPANKSPELTGRVVQISSSANMARNFSCGGYTGECAVGLTPVPIVMLADDINDQDATDIYCVYNTGYPSGCTNNGQTSSTQVQMTHNFWSDNSNVIQLVSSANSSAQWQAMAGGTANTHVTAYPTYNASNSCTTAGVATVPIPKAIPVYADSSNGPSTGCPSGQAGWTRMVIRQVEDQNGYPINMGGLKITEAVNSGPGANGLNLSLRVSPAVTNDQGQVMDTFAFCSSVCPGSSLTSDFTQTVTLTSSTGMTYNLGSYDLLYSCGSVKVDGK